MIDRFRSTDENRLALVSSTKTRIWTSVRLLPIVSLPDGNVSLEHSVRCLLVALTQRRIQKVMLLGELGREGARWLTCRLGGLAERRELLPWGWGAEHRRKRSLYILELKNLWHLGGMSHCITKSVYALTLSGLTEDSQRTEHSWRWRTW